MTTTQHTIDARIIIRLVQCIYKSSESVCQVSSGLLGLGGASFMGEGVSVRSAVGSSGGKDSSTCS